MCKGVQGPAPTLQKEGAAAKSTAICMIDRPSNQIPGTELEACVRSLAMSENTTGFPWQPTRRAWRTSPLSRALRLLYPITARRPSGSSRTTLAGLQKRRLR